MPDRPRISAIVVVEGLHDKQAVLRAVDADVWVLGGDRVNRSIIAELERASLTRGVIVLTDPDGPGERIRRRLTEALPNCQHAFVLKAQAIGGGAVGVEHATVPVIREAILAARMHTTESVCSAPFTLADLREFGLAGQPSSAQFRQRVGDALGIGYANAKAFVWKLNALGITRDEWETAVHHALGGLSADEQ